MTEVISTAADELRTESKEWPVKLWLLWLLSLCWINPFWEWKILMDNKKLDDLVECIKNLWDIYSLDFSSQNYKSFIDLVKYVISNNLFKAALLELVDWIKKYDKKYYTKLFKKLDVNASLNQTEKKNLAFLFKEPKVLDLIETFKTDEIQSLVESLESEESINNVEVICPIALEKRDFKVDINQFNYDLKQVSTYKLRSQKVQIKTTPNFQIIELNKYWFWLIENSQFFSMKYIFENRLVDKLPSLDDIKLLLKKENNLWREFLKINNINLNSSNVRYKPIKHWLVDWQLWVVDWLFLLRESFDNIKNKDLNKQILFLRIQYKSDNPSQNILDNNLSEDDVIISPIYIDRSKLIDTNFRIRLLDESSIVGKEQSGIQLDNKKVENTPNQQITSNSWNSVETSTFTEISDTDYRVSSVWWKKEVLSLHRNFRDGFTNVEIKVSPNRDAFELCGPYRLDLEWTQFFTMEYIIRNNLVKYIPSFGEIETMIKNCGNSWIEFARKYKINDILSRITISNGTINRYAWLYLVKESFDNNEETEILLFTLFDENNQIISRDVVWNKEVYISNCHDVEIRPCDLWVNLLKPTLTKNAFRLRLKK